jgi:hypothetical protein
MGVVRICGALVVIGAFMAAVTRSDGGGIKVA